MTVEFSHGYIGAARRKIERLESSLSPRARSIARELSRDLSESSTHFSVKERALAFRQLNLPPDTDGIYLAWDDKGRPWLLKFNCSGAEGEWTALGFDERSYPSVIPIEGQPNKRYLLSPPIKIRRWVAVVAL